MSYPDKVGEEQYFDKETVKLWRLQRIPYIFQEHRMGLWDK